MFYDTLCSLCEREHKSVAQVMRDLDFSSGTATRWRQGTARPSYKTLQKIARYFDVPVGIFLDEDNDPNKEEVQWFYERLDFLCNEIGKTVPQVMRELGLSTVSATHWKNGTAEPSIETIEQIASYLKVPVGDLQRPVSVVRKLEPFDPSTVKIKTTHSAEFKEVVDSLSQTQLNRLVEMCIDIYDLAPEKRKLLFEIINVFLKDNNQ